MKSLLSLFSRSKTTPPASPSAEPDDLIDALLAGAVGNTEGRDTFYRELLEGELTVPGEAADGELFVRPYDINRKRTLLLFSTPLKLRRALPDNPPSVTLPSRTLLRAALTFDAAILNYRAPHAKEFTRSEMEAILDGSIFAQSCSTGEYRSIILGQPKHYPVALMDHLRGTLPARREVRAAYIAQVAEEGSLGEPTVVIAFDTAMEGEKLKGLTDEASAAAARLGFGSVLFTRLANDGLGEYLRSETAPFYRA